MQLLNLYQPVYISQKELSMISNFLNLKTVDLHGQNYLEKKFQKDLKYVYTGSPKEVELEKEVDYQESRNKAKTLLKGYLNAPYIEKRAELSPAENIKSIFEKRYHLVYLWIENELGNGAFAKKLLDELENYSNKLDTKNPQLIEFKLFKNKIQKKVIDKTNGYEAVFLDIRYNGVQLQDKNADELTIQESDLLDQKRCSEILMILASMGVLDFLNEHFEFETGESLIDKQKEFGKILNFIANLEPESDGMRKALNRLCGTNSIEFYTDKGLKRSKANWNTFNIRQKNEKKFPSHYKTANDYEKAFEKWENNPKN